METQYQTACDALRVFAAPPSSDEFSKADAYLRSLQTEAARSPAGAVILCEKLLSGPAASDTVRHFGLQLLTAAIAATPAGGSAGIRPLLLTLLANASRGVVTEAKFVKEKLASAFAEVAKREWPQNWPTMLNDLLLGVCEFGRAPQQSKLKQIEVVAICLRTLATECGSNAFGSRVSSQRRGEVLQGLTASSSSLLGWLSDSMAMCVGILSATAGGAAAVEQSPTAAAMLCGSLLDCLSSLLSFLPAQAFRQCAPWRILQALWAALVPFTQAAAASAVPPAVSASGAPSSLCPSPFMTDAGGDGGGSPVSPPVLSSLLMSSIGLLEVIACRKHDTEGGEGDLLVGGLGACVHLLEHSVALGYQPKAARGGSASAAVAASGGGGGAVGSPAPLTSLPYPVFRQLITTAMDGIGRSFEDLMEMHNAALILAEGAAAGGAVVTGASGSAPFSFAFGSGGSTVAAPAAPHAFRSKPPTKVKAWATAAASSCMSPSSTLLAGPSEVLHRCLSLLPGLLLHPSAIVRSCTAQVLAEAVLLHPSFPSLPAAQGLIATTSRPLLLCMVKEARFVPLSPLGRDKLTASSIPISLIAESQDEDAWAAEPLTSVSTAAAPGSTFGGSLAPSSAPFSPNTTLPYPTSLIPLSCGVRDYLRGIDFTAEDQEEYHHTLEVIRGRATRALGWQATLQPGLIAQLLQHALQRGAAMTAGMASYPPSSTPDGANALGTSTQASQANRWLDGMNACLEHVMASMPPHAMTTEAGIAVAAAGGGGGGGMVPSIAARAALPALQEALTTILALPRADPAVTNRVPPMLAHLYPLLSSQPSLLGPILSALFALVEYSPPEGLTAAAAASAAAASSAAAGTPLPTGVLKADATAPAAVVWETQMVRQRSCQSLVALSQKIPATLLPALQPLASTVVGLLGRGGMAAADRVSLLELLLLVGNAMAAGSGDGDAAALVPSPRAGEHASLVAQVTQPALEAWASAPLTAAVASTKALLSHIGISSSPAGVPSVLITATPATATTQTEALFTSLHTVWAVARRCTAAELSTAASGDAGKGKGKFYSAKAGGGSGSGGSASSGSIPGILAPSTGPAGDKIVPPLFPHPFSSFWPSILPQAIALVASLHGLWSQEGKALIMAHPGAAAPAPGSPGDVTPAEAASLSLSSRYLLALSDEEAKVLGQVGRARGKGDSDGEDEDDDEEEEKGRAFSPAGAIPPEAVPVIDPSTGVIALQKLPIPPSAVPASLSFATWHTRCLWHAYGLIHLSVTSHLLASKHAAALCDARPPSLSPRVSSAAASGHGAAAALAAAVAAAAAVPPPLPLDEHTVIANWAPCGLFSPSLLPSCWPALKAALAPSLVKQLPLRILRMIVQQLLPGLIAACPPLPTYAGEMGSLVAGVLDPTLALLEGMAVLATGSAGSASAGASSASNAASTAFDTSIGVLLPKACAPRPKAVGLEVMRDRLRREGVRAVLDLMLTLVPPQDWWYSLHTPLTPSSSAAASSPFDSSPSSPSSAPAAYPTMLLRTPAIFDLLPKTPGAPPTMPPPGSPPLTITAAVLSSPDRMPRLARCILFSSPAGGPFCSLLGTVFRHADAVALRKAIACWQRLLPQLSSEAGDAAAAGGGSSPAGALSAWSSSALSFFSDGCTALVQAQPDAVTCEWELVPVLIDMLCRGRYGASSQVAHPIRTPVVPIPSLHASVPPAAYPPFTDPATPLHILSRLPGLSPAAIATFEQRVCGANGEKERRNALRELLQTSAEAVEGAAGGTASAGSVAAGGGGGGKKGKSKSAVGNLPTRLVLQGRATGGWGSATEAPSRPSALDSDGGGGLSKLFGGDDGDL